ncbi:MAG: metallophosphoesterase, partial [Myxococcota bacterium]
MKASTRYVHASAVATSHQEGAPMSQATARPTRLAHVTDAHTTLDGRATTVLKHRAVDILNDVLEQIRHRKSDCVLFGGDNIDNRGAADRDIAAFERLVEPLSDWRYVVGNHEASRPKPGRITKAQFQRRFGANGIPPDAPG